jgi:vacuolar-type H+-ATPase subunit F/Vma7
LIMTDIVDRLRQRVAAETGEAPFLTAIPNYMLHREAAERIAELEAALRQIAAPANWSPVLIDSANANTLNEQIHEIRMIAANALRK